MRAWALRVTPSGFVNRGDVSPTQKFMENWNAAQYLKYGDERTRAAADLAARVKLERPETIADLGCGPGNSTEVLRSRWPTSNIIGIDNSAAMIDAAKRSFPGQSWVLADVADWAPANSIALVYSNAALQWLPNHGSLVRRLFSFLAPGGALAFQIPSSTYATVRTLIHDISNDPAWTQRMVAPRTALTMEPPSFYYDSLAAEATALDIWEIEYNHVMDSQDEIVDWIASTGLRPFLAALDSESERNRFVIELRRRVSSAYELRSDGKVLFPFRRTFVIAYR
jgi:trans-aconitate 2-methyltransferase